MDATQPAPAVRWPWLTEAAVVLLLVTLTFKLTYGIWKIRDVWVGDETAYLICGTSIPAHGLPSPEAGPLYPLWYLALSRLPIDLLLVTHVNWACLAALLTVSFYVLLRHFGCSRPWALFACVLLLTSEIVDVLPQPMHLAAVVLAVGAAVATRFRSPINAFAAVGLTLLVATYVRPEYSLSLMVYGVAAVALAGWVLLRRPEMRKQLVLPALMLAVTVAAFVLVFRFPPLDGSRSFIAFGQHYSLNLSKAGLREGNPWHTWEAAVHADFGEVTSFGQAARSNPRAVLWHVGRNVTQLPMHLAAMLPVRLDLSPRGAVWFSVWFWTATLLGAACLAWRVYRFGLSGAENRPLTVALVLMAFLLVPASIQCLLIFPRQHYLLPLTVFALALVTASVPQLAPPSWVPRLAGWQGLLAIAVVAALFVPNRVHGWNVQRWLRWRTRPETPKQDVIPSVRLLRHSGVAGPVVVLEHAYYGWARSFYVSQPHRLLFHSDKKEGFAEFLRKHDVGVVMLSPTLANDPLYASDPEFRQFVTERGGDAFAVLEAPRGLTRVAVRKDLLGH